MSRPSRALHRATSRATAVDSTVTNAVVVAVVERGDVAPRRRRGRAPRAAARVASTARTQSGCDASPSRRLRAESDAQPPGRRADLVAVRADRRRRGVRVAGRGARDRVEHRGGVADRPGEHELVRERAPVLAEVGSERGAGAGRLESDDAAHGRGEPDRAAHVVAVRDRAPARPRPRPPSRRSNRPVLRVRSHGLCVAPYASGSVVTLVASSGVLVLPTNTKPAARKRAASQVSSGSVQPASFSSRMPHVERIARGVTHRVLHEERHAARTGRGRGRGLVGGARSKRRWMTALSAGVDAFDAVDRGVDELARRGTRRAATSSAWAVASRKARSSVIGAAYVRIGGVVTRRLAGSDVACERDCAMTRTRWTTASSHASPHARRRRSNR